MSVTADGRQAVSAGWPDTLQVWDLETGACLRTLGGHNNGAIYSVAVTRDGRRAVSAHWDRTLQVWDLEAGYRLRTLKGHKDFVSDVSVTADGRRAVSSGADRTLRVWDLQTGARLRTMYSMHPSGSVSVTPEGTLAVWATRDGLEVWDLKAGTRLRTLKGHAADLVSGVSVMPDGHRAISASLDKTLRVWDLDTGACLVVLRANAPVYGVAVSRFNRRVVAGLSTGEVLVFETRGLERDLKGSEVQPVKETDIG